MKVQVVGLFMLLCIGFTNSYYVDRFGPRNHQPVTYTYDRVDEVNKACSSVLASAVELKRDRSRGYGITEELSFVNGDWWQDAKEAPLMPFHDIDQFEGSSDLRSPAQLASFWVNDFDRAHRSKKSINVSGFLRVDTTLEEAVFSDRPFEGSPRFDLYPGRSQLSIPFQGIYTESKDNGGERVICLLGNAMLPSRTADASDPWEWMKEPGFSEQPPLLQDDRILLVLRYPKTFTLTNRAIRGSMRSLNPKSNLKFFNEVLISSWLGESANYQFGSETIVSKACNPYPYKDSLMKSGIETYKGLDFCSILDRFAHGDAMTIVPNWRCNGTDAYCSKLGPFSSDKGINATDGSFKDVKLVLQDVRCTTENPKNNVGVSKVSAVLRAVPPYENQYSAAQRTGLSNMTLSAEGMWNSSTGQLCMVGCLGIVDTEGNGCNTRICVYVPLLFSIKQRSIILGTISDINETAGSFFPLSFEKLVRPSELWDQYTASHPYYSYSKMDSAIPVMEKNEPFDVRTVIKKSLLTFPKPEDNESYEASLSLLAEDLTVHTSAFPDPMPISRPSRTDIQMEIVSLGPLFGRYWSPQFRNGTEGEEEAPYHGKAEYTEKQLLLNVSAQLTVTGKPYSNISVLFLEGLYDEHVGKMYLIGCRDVRASWNILFESMDLQAGLDCLIEVVVAYPPTTARWLVSPNVKISISSQRTDDDPLYFSPVSLQSSPLMYRKQREDILSRRGVEGILRIMTLSVAVACILSQLFYIRENLDSLHFMSLVMLGVQALGYSLPLITGAEAIFKRAGSESYESSSYDLQKSQWLEVIDYTVKLLVLVSFLLTLRLCQKVWKSRSRLLKRAPNGPQRVPSDKRVLFVTSVIHVIGYVIVLVVHSKETSQRPFRTDRFVDSNGSSRTLHEWQTELEEYVGLAHDFFLLPQIIGNLLWQIDCKPLRKFYFVGITVVRVLPHFYDYIKSPIVNPYFSEEYEFVNPQFDFFSKFGDIAIPVTAVFLAIVVYVQQRWSYEKLSKILTFGKFKLLPLGSTPYERLPSKVQETELVSGSNNDINTHKNEEARSDD